MFTSHQPSGEKDGKGKVCGDGEQLGRRKEMATSYGGRKREFLEMILRRRVECVLPDLIKWSPAGG